MAGLFGSLGYMRVPGFGIDLRRDDFSGRLRSFLIDQANRRDDDVVVIYYTGHGVLNQGGLLLPMADTTSDVAYTALRAGELTGLMLSDGDSVRVVVQQLLFLLDTCYSGAAGSALTSGAIDFTHRLRGLARNPSVAILVAARPNEQAASCEFSRAFVEAVGQRASGGYQPEFLPLDGLVGVVNAQTPDWQHAELFHIETRTAQFLPNPRFNPWLRDLDLDAQARQRLQLARATDQHDHVMPHAQGLDTANSAADLWLFTGRHAALAEACRWLRSPSDPATLVVTGSPGSGKSALLARLTVLADQKLRGRVPGLHTLPEATLPTPGSIARFIHARGLTTEELMAGLCEACDVEQTTNPGRLLESLSGRTDPIVVVVDAIDEAGQRTELDRGQAPVVDCVLAPLIREAGRTPLRLMLGTRRNLLPALAKPAEVLDLDLDRYADPATMRRYIESCLVDLAEGSAYRHQPRSYLRQVAEAIADAAGSSFLVALITARSLALTPRLVDPDDRAWRKGLPKMAADAMRTDLEQRLGTEAGRARELLLPLAYAKGSGLPWEDVWPRLVRALTGRPCGNADLDRLFDDVGYYITESTSDDGYRSVYRLYHEALAEYLRAIREDPFADETAIVDTLTDHTPRLPDGQRDWSQAHPYVITNLASHAAGTRRLDPLVTDPRFLLAASSPHLLAVLPSATTWPARAAADAFRRAAGRLRTSRDRHRPACLQLAARCARAPALADSIKASGLPLSYVTDWASWRLQATHMTLPGHTDSVNAVASGQIEDRPVIISGSDDGTVRVWDPTTGTPIGQPLTGHAGPVNAVASGQIDGRTVIISGSDDGTVRVWDPTTGTPAADPFTGHAGPVNAVASGQADGRTVIISGSDDGTVRVWDATTGTPIGQPLTGHTGYVNAVAFGQVNGQPVIISGSTDRTLRIWDVTTGVPAGDPFTGHTGYVNAVAFGQVNGRTVIVSGGDDGTVRVWDPTTGTPIGRPLTGHSGPVSAVASGQADGRTVIISGSDDGTVRIWDATTGTPIGQPLTGHADWVRAVAFGQADGRPVIISGSTDQTVRVWDTTTGTPIGDPFTGHTGDVNAVAFGQTDGQTVIISGSTDQTVRVWDTTGAPLGQPLTGHTGYVNAVAFGQTDGQTVIISGSTDQTVRVWDAATGTPIGDPFIGHTGPVNAVATGQADGRTVIISGGDDATVRIWDATTGTPLGQPITDHTGPVNAVAFGQADGQPVIVSGGDDGTVRIWDATTGTPIGQPITDHTGPVNAVAFGQADGQPVIVSGGEDGTVRIWDATTGTPIGQPLTDHTDWVRAVAFGQADGRTVIVSGSDDGTVRIWDATTGTPIGRPLTGHTGPVSAVASGQADGRTVIVSGSTDQTVRIWDATTGTLIGDPFIGHTGPVNAVATGQADGRTVLISGSDDATVRIWDAATGAFLGHPLTGHTGPVNAVAFGQADGQPAIISGSDRPDRADVGRRHRRLPRPPPHRPHRPGERGSVRPGRWPAGDHLRQH